MTGDELESIVTQVPGPRSHALNARLARVESQNVTMIANDYPIVWDSARGCVVRDVDGNHFLDFGSAFGVAAVGHANPTVAAAIAEMARRLPHGMGDVHPSAIRVELLERLRALVPLPNAKAYLASGGAEAVEAALKTAVLATGRTRFAAFEGAYHGLSLGALGVCGMERFRAPFAGALGPAPVLLQYPRYDDDVAERIALVAATLEVHDDLAAVIVEPIAGRAGGLVPPPGYLAALRALCDRRRILLIVDEIYTGFGRTGRWFAFEHEGIVPDIVCVGKAMGGGFPISATLARGEIMDAWPPSTGEALHTATFLGNPMGCAAALAAIGEIEARDLPARAAAREPWIRERLERMRSRAMHAVRGRGMLWAIELDPGTAAQVVREALRRGLLLLQTGSDGSAIAIAPPLVISDGQIERGMDLLQAALEAAA